MSAELIRFPHMRPAKPADECAAQRIKDWTIIQDWLRMGKNEVLALKLHDVAADFETIIKQISEERIAPLQ